MKEIHIDHIDQQVNVIMAITISTLSTDGSESVVYGVFIPQAAIPVGVPWRVKVEYLAADAELYRPEGA